MPEEGGIQCPERAIPMGPTLGVKKGKFWTLKMEVFLVFLVLISAQTNWTE